MIASLNILKHAVLSGCVQTILLRQTVSENKILETNEQTKTDSEVYTRDRLQNRQFFFSTGKERRFVTVFSTSRHS